MTDRERDRMAIGEVNKDWDIGKLKEGETATERERSNVETLKKENGYCTYKTWSKRK